MEKTKFMTKEQRENLSNRVILNFGLLLVGALLMLYVYSFVNARWINETANVLMWVGIISFVVAVAFFVLGLTKAPKLKNYSFAFLGMTIASFIVFSPKFKFMQINFPGFDMMKAIKLVFILMAVYFVIFAIVTGIILKTHPEAPVEKNKIQHAKKKNKKRK